MTDTPETSHEIESIRVAEFDVYLASLPDETQPTAVALGFKLDAADVTVYLDECHEVDGLIAQLIQHRNVVWPKAKPFIYVPQISKNA